jgi:hypothetical protein
MHYVVADCNPKPQLLYKTPIHHVSCVEILCVIPTFGSWMSVYVASVKSHLRKVWGIYQLKF